ncbi:metallophosphoesterase [Enterococcus saccharolyticus]|uniref:metallophosphoesterase n=1 Tax=Enterococcus TaxID=1350 RepID=UPI001E4B8400|nr:metallophosphoesterase [Enterococcus saccharolyticus]MCD5001899.1 metallophosphoesterase [Enterococcus saccharolyticus]
MLRCRSDGRFMIAHFTDLHIGYPNNEADKRTIQELTACLKTLDADLLIFTGDQIWCYGENDPYQGFQQVIDCINQCEIPVVITYGNHDSEHGKILREELRSMEQGLKNRVFGEQQLVTKERLSEIFYIYEATGQRIVKQLVVFDSGDYVSEKMAQQLIDKQTDNCYAYLYPEQVRWFEECQLPLETTIFLHIPLIEYQQAKNFIRTGQCLEPICSSEINSGLFSVLVEQEQAVNVFCGHDHDNDFTAEWLGVGLHYGRISGYNVYGQFARGYRQVVLSEDEPLTTRIMSYEQTREIKS